MSNQAYTTEVANGRKYITTIYRGTEYTLRGGKFGWEVSTRRLNYGGRFHMGSFKRFDNVAALVAGCKAFGDASNVIALAFGIETSDAIAA